MGTKKDIGSAIKERMADYKPNPDPKLWQNIKLNLELKNRKRALFGWMFFSGLLLLIIGLSLVLFTTNYLETPKSNQIASPETENIDSNSTNANKKRNNVNVTTAKTHEEAKDAANNNMSESGDKNTDFKTYVEKTSANGNTIYGPTLVNANKTTTNKSDGGSNKALSTPLSKTVGHNNKQTESKKDLNNSNDASVAYSNNNSQSSSPSKKENNISDNNEVEINEDKNLAQNKDKTDYKIVRNAKDSDTSSKKETLSLNLPDSLKQVKDNEGKTKKLTMYRKEDSIKQAQRFYSFTLFSGISPSEFISRDSTIDPALNDNDTEQAIKLNYGAMLNFNNDDRFSIRLGIFYQRYQTTVNNVEPFTSLRYVDLKPSSNELSSFFSNGTNFSIEQEYSYILVPVEVRYDLLKDSSLLGLLGSFNFSSLNNNEVNLISGNNNALDLGTSSLAKTELSIGAGLNLRPQISEKLFINIESLLYYQPFRDNSLPVRSDVEIQFRVGIEYKLK